MQCNKHKQSPLCQLDDYVIIVTFLAVESKSKEHVICITLLPALFFSSFLPLHVRFTICWVTSEIAFAALIESCSIPAA